MLNVRTVRCPSISADVGIFGASSVRNPAYKRIPVGAIKPTGWALQQARTQADGLVSSAS